MDSEERPLGVPYRNTEGYPDPTAHKALSLIQREQDEADCRVNRFLKAIKTLIDMSGYDLLARIELRDRKTGKEYF